MKLDCAPPCNAAALAGLSAGYVTLVPNPPIWAQPSSPFFTPAQAVAEGYVALNSPAPSPVYISAPAPVYVPAPAPPPAATPIATHPQQAVQWSSIYESDPTAPAASSGAPTYGPDDSGTGGLVGSGNAIPAATVSSPNWLLWAAVGVAALFALKHK